VFIAKTYPGGQSIRLENNTNWGGLSAKLPIRF